MRPFASLVIAFWMAAAVAPLSAAQAAAAPVRHKTGKIVITVDVNRHYLWVEKVTRRGRFQLSGATLPMVKESLHLGTFRPTKLYTRYRTVHGNTYLENVIFFDGARALRTTRHFAELQKAGRSVSGAVTLEPDFGQILFETVQTYGPAQTVIQLR